ncbi:MAG: hypothetical protein Tsb0015_13750 [Simkaniaceae bacterium]
MKKWLGFFCIFCSTCFAENGQNAVQEPGIGSLQECAKLSTEEQSFASQLGLMHKMLFCGQFTSSQRQEAMNMVKQSRKPPKQGIWQSQTDEMGMSPDEAVEAILKKNRKNNAKSKK